MDKWNRSAGPVRGVPGGDRGGAVGGAGILVLGGLHYTLFAASET
jgi:hypothetical protein